MNLNKKIKMRLIKRFQVENKELEIDIEYDKDKESYKIMYVVVYDFDNYDRINLTEFFKLLPKVEVALLSSIDWNEVFTSQQNDEKNGR